LDSQHSHCRTWLAEKPQGTRTESSEKSAQVGPQSDHLPSELQIVAPLREEDATSTGTGTRPTREELAIRPMARLSRYPMRRGCLWRILEWRTACPGHHASGHTTGERAGPWKRACPSSALSLTARNRTPETTIGIGFSSQEQMVVRETALGLRLTVQAGA
jgi:hypothetical protein